MPISELKDILITVGEFETAGGAHGFINNHLENKKGYLAHRRISPREKARFFPEAKGYRDVVVVTALGQARLDEVNQRVEGLFNGITTGLRGLPIKSAIALFRRMAPALIKDLQRRAKSLSAASDVVVTEATRQGSPP